MSQADLLRCKSYCNSHRGVFGTSDDPILFFEIVGQFVEARVAPPYH